MAINDKRLGTATDAVNPANTGDVLPKLIDHNTTEQAFQEGMDDVARQVDRTQLDLGYNQELTPAIDEMGLSSTSGRTGAGRQARTVHDRLNTIEDGIGVPNNASSTIDGMTGTLLVGRAMGSDIGGTISNMTINDGVVDFGMLSNNSVRTAQLQSSATVDGERAVGTDHIQNEAVTLDKIAPAANHITLVSGTHTVTPDVPLGGTATVPIFDRAMSRDGVVSAPMTTQETVGDNVYVLSSENGWIQLNDWVLNGRNVPSTDVETTAGAQDVSAALTAPGGFSAVATYLADAMNRSFALNNGDLIHFTDTTPNPDVQYAVVYIGPNVQATANALASNFVELGAVQTYDAASGGGLVRTGTEFSIAPTIPAAREFSGEVTLSSTTNPLTVSMGPATFNEDVVLGSAADDNITVNGQIVAPNGFNPDTPELGLGTNNLRWNVTAHDVSFDGDLTGTITNNNIGDDTISVDKLDADEADRVGQIPTVVRNTADTDDIVMWQDPPIGVQIVSMLSAATGVVVGTVVSLDAQDGGNAPGIYRAQSIMPGPPQVIDWVRLGQVGAIISKQQLVSSTNPTQVNYTTTRIAPAHFITIDGLVLVEREGTNPNYDYTVDPDRLGFTLREAVAAGKDIVVHNFSDVATLGAGELNVNALASTGTLPSGITVENANAADTVDLTATSAVADYKVVFADTTGHASVSGETMLIDDDPSDFTWNPSTSTLGLGDGWSIEAGTNGLIFRHGGTAVCSISNNGAIISANNITAFGTPESS